MSRIFVSFIGRGKLEPVEYASWRKGGLKAQNTAYVQKAILELYPYNQVDRVILLVTKTSKKKHYDHLIKELLALGISESCIKQIEISEDLTQLDAAWEWFEKLQNEFNHYDTLVMDITHGFRIVPIVFSAAVSYLRRVKQVKVEAVLYGAYDAPGKPIVDIKDFYTISDWAEGVGRLVDDADTSFLRNTAQAQETGSFCGLNDPKLLEAVTDLTESFKNVELQQVEKKARLALELIEKKMSDASVMERQILGMIVDKFSPLISTPPLQGEYSFDYLSLQLNLIGMLAEHGLYMQSFTAMREWLGSLGCFLSEKNMTMGSNTKDNSARAYAEIFIRMLQYNCEKWNFSDEQNSNMVKKLMPAWQRLGKIINLHELEEQMSKLTKIRNGFDHGWTGSHRTGVPPDIKEQHKESLAYLNNILNKIKEVEPGRCK